LSQNGGGSIWKTFYPKRKNPLYLHPSEDLGKIAVEEERALPKTIRFLLRGLGPIDEGADLLSYLFFEPAYCARLVKLGFSDTISHTSEIANFMTA
jgi:NTE family protein